MTDLGALPNLLKFVEKHGISGLCINGEEVQLFDESKTIVIKTEIDPAYINTLKTESTTPIPKIRKEPTLSSKFSVTLLRDLLDVFEDCADVKITIGKDYPLTIKGMTYYGTSIKGVLAPIVKK